MTPERANEVARKITNRLMMNVNGDQADHLKMYDVRDCYLGGWCRSAVEKQIAAALVEATKPPEGAVLVRVAVGRGFDDGREMVGACAIDEYDSEESACRQAFDLPDDVTHRGIIEAYLPPVAPVPVVEAE